VFAQTPKAGPADRPLSEPTTIHRVKVINGTCSIGQRLIISVGAAHTGQAATIIITGTACHLFIEGNLIRQLTLNPNRRVQSLYPNRGNPHRKPPLKP